VLNGVTYLLTPVLSESHVFGPLKEMNKRRRRKSRVTVMKVHAPCLHQDVSGGWTSVDQLSHTSAYQPQVRDIGEREDVVQDAHELV
jgi:hypothetical protein